MGKAPPKVDLQPYRELPVAIQDEAMLETLVRQAFTQRRKTLRNALRGMLEEEAIRSLGIDPSVRAEMLGLREFAALANLAASRLPRITEKHKDV